MKNTYKALGTMGSIFAAGYLAFAPVNADAFYVSEKEAQKAGISRKDITKDKQPMGDTVSYKGYLEGDETFNDIARRVNNWAEDFFGAELSEEMTRGVLSEFNSYRKVEMPLVSTPCKYQFMMNYVKQLEKDVAKTGKPGYTEKDLEFLKGQLHELEELYEQDITDLKERYNDHEKRIQELESSPEQKDYSGEIEELKKESNELREMIKGMEGAYAQPVVEEGGEYAEPPEVEGYPSGGEVVYGQPTWFVGVPYPYIILNGSIYERYWIGDTFRWRHWGWLDFYGDVYYARGLDGRIHYYQGSERHTPLFRHHRPETRPWDHGKGRVIHPRDHHRRKDPCDPGHRGRERPGDRGRRWERQPPREDYRRYQPPKRDFPGAQHNSQFNQPRGGFRPQVPRQGHGNFQNFQRGQHFNPQFSAPRGGFQQGGRGFQRAPQVNPQAPGNQFPRRGGRQ